MGTEKRYADKYKTVNCLGFNVYADDLNKISLSQTNLINTINQYSYCITQQDAAFKTALQQSDILLPDGIGITFAAKFFENKTIKKIAGADIHQFLIEKCSRENKSFFYLGSSTNTLNLIKDRLKQQYPDSNIGFYSPPYKAKFTEEDNLQMINAVNNFKPAVLFVGMTAPKQEKWAYEYKDKLDANIICSIGAVFDFYAGTVKRPNKVWINLGLEWFIRLLKEPKRMSKRYLYYGPLFVITLIKMRLNLLFNKSR